MAKYEYTKVAQHGIPAGVKLTDMMKQYVDAKSKYPDALLFFRMGDFYEMFFEDAENGGRHLGLTVTSRNKDASISEPMSGFPHHQLSAYLNRALEAGFKVSVCDQLSDPRESKGVVERGITQVVTPGVLLEGEGLQDRANHYLVSIFPQGPWRSGEREVIGGELFGFAAIDVSSGLFQVTELVGLSALRCELSRLDAKEVLIPHECDLLVEQIQQRFPALTISPLDLTFFEEAQARRLLQRLMTDHGQPSVESMCEYGFGVNALPLGAAGAAAGYVIDTQKSFPESVRCLNPYQMRESMVIDDIAGQNLELFKTLLGKKKKGSLFGVLDHASTSMGARRIRRWLTYPLLQPAQINARLDAVERLKDEVMLRRDLRTLLKQLSDLERLNTRAALGKATPKEVAKIRDSLSLIPDLKALLAGDHSLSYIEGRLDPLPTLCGMLRNALVDAPPALLKEGGVVRRGFDQELDEIVEIYENGKEWILELESREREMTGIGSLKVRYNRVFGYYIEVSKANLKYVPDHYQRRQTLTNAERYYTQELKEFEDKVLNAESRRATLEADIFSTLRGEVSNRAAQITLVSEAIADLDALSTLAEVAHKNGYCRPAVTEEVIIDIREGRHPVVEQAVGREAFIPNDLYLDRDSRLMMITGPNMAGKSTIMRQVALITLLAQMGSFVPAQSATIGVVDRIFTRVGATDDLASGRSTFMVEMSEAATILNEATAQSLVILDEIGRGTSTFDGVSIAWAVAEHLHDHILARTLFATHYHELTELSETRSAVKNYTVAVSHDQEEIIFLHQLIPGGANRSYGIQVAELAGIPGAVIERAKGVLAVLEDQGDYQGVSPTGKGRDDVIGRGKQSPRQLSLFSPPSMPSSSSEVERAIKSADLNQMTPMQALNFLHTLADKVKR